MSEQIECQVCGEYFDPASLQEVFIHEHNGSVPNEDITGEKLE